MRSKELLSFLATVAIAGPSERSLLLHTGTLGALMSMCLGADSPYPELVQSPRPRRRLQSGKDEGRSSPASPRRPYRSSFPPVAEATDDGDGGGGGQWGARSGQRDAYGAKKDLLEVRGGCADVLMGVRVCVRRPGVVKKQQKSTTWDEYY